MASPAHPALRRALPLLTAALALAALAPPAASASGASGSTAATPVAERSEESKTATPPVLPLAPASPDLPGLPPMSRALSSVEVDSTEFRRAADAYGQAAGTHTARQDARVGIDRATTDLGNSAGVLEARLAAAEARLAALRSRLDDVEASIADLSVHLYVTGGSSERMDEALTSEQPAINDSDRRAVLGNASMDVLLAERAAYQARVEEAEARIADAERQLDDVVDELSSVTAGRAAATHHEVQAAAAVAEARVAYEDARVLATVDGVQFPLVALDAYYRAAESLAEQAPACDIRWWALAGISQVEGHHGTYGGSRLDARGDTTKRIIGVQLNGTDNTAVIADTDDGALDGDAEFDRAVGPMQFIPQTWMRFRSDGNDDGVATPFNLYDATMAAARYLCRASSGLGADPGLRAAYFSYNHSDAYVERVLSFARLYQSVVEVP